MGRATLQQERSRATRKAIMAAAETLWREQGFDEVSVDDVCQAAGVAKGTFYFYFPRKEHLLVMLVFARMTPRTSQVEALMGSDLDTVSACMEVGSIVAERVRGLEKPLVQRAVEESYRHYREIHRLHGTERDLRSYFLPLFQRGRERGEIDESWSVELLGLAMGSSMMQGLQLWATEVVSDREVEEHLRQRAELIATGAAQRRAANPARLAMDPVRGAA